VRTLRRFATLDLALRVVGLLPSQIVVAGGAFLVWWISR